ncbi:RNA polymerase sigma factor [Stutzerimonas kirkiae]|uniref:RNA polymerase subunit sigma-70 n=1 Tax=Stutzerimonas kirkiae TaxID=2211392 RepID=A0A4Q9RBY8_9GAMM|nr:RNA polymerase sigma factor [Stutzerimonas kirkiae]TBU97358.1 RNA polymerase subunit sigma-70 [Stutzerimonas kirkiae]TBU98232.1 RNA polymerase subunit sigma-70 [Stutzerimonas kirkiae]TBV06614.1 RNA polymerase subunit sigma-70 [Stutzerimonas kirkiae]TBV13090.1 RNA polymerase subunit sigma-70 [Stutzerimonas kirkiae]
MLERLFAEYSGRLRRYLLQKTRDPELSSDLVQETFARLARQQGLEAIENQSSYVFRTANNLLVDHVRQVARKRTEAVPSEVLEQVADEAPGTEEHALEELDLMRVRKTLLGLPPRTREIFYLCRIKGIAQHKVAERLGVSPSTVQKHLALVVAHVSKALGPRPNRK